MSERVEGDGRGQEGEGPGMRTTVVETYADEFPFELGHGLIAVLCDVEVDGRLEGVELTLEGQVAWWLEVVVEIGRVGEWDCFFLKRWWWIERKHGLVPSVVDGLGIAVELEGLSDHGGQGGGVEAVSRGGGGMPTERTLMVV